MNPTDPLPTEAFWQEDPFAFIQPKDFESLGIDPADISPGTFPAKKHPSQIPSRFGGNAYGFGFFELHDRLSSEDIDLIQSIRPENADDLRTYYREINKIYKKVGLLIRVSSLGHPYYLIPVNLVSGSLSHIKNRADEISKIIHYHHKKYLKESYKIGLLTHADDLLFNDLSIRFKEHQFTAIDSFEKLRTMKETQDLVILNRDIYELVFMEKFGPRQKETPSKRQLEDYAIYMLGKIYNLLKQDGEICIIANRYALKTNQTVSVKFKTVLERKNFLLFSHIFRTRKKYLVKGESLEVNKFDFQRYLGGLYVEQEVLDGLLEGRVLEKLSLEEIDRLPYLNFSLDNGFAYEQDEVWPRLLSIFFDEIFLKSLVPESIKADWKKRFSTGHETFDYLILYLGQKKPAETNLEELKRDIMDSRLSGCPLSLLADYRDSFDYLIRTLNVLNQIKKQGFSGLSDIFVERLRQPLEDKKRRYSGINDVLKLMSKINRLERIRSSLNPDMIEGPKTKILKHLAMLPLFGFNAEEIREIFLIVVGHTPMGRILLGKMNEKALKPVSDLARTFEPHQALNLLRYCRLMSMAETVASTRTEMNQAQVEELFSLYESMVRVVTNREMDWDRLLDEKTSAMGGIHNKIIRKILKMMNYFQFLDTWSELGHKGEMEKESLADYDDKKLAKIENVIKLIETVDQFEETYLKEDPLEAAIFYRKLLNIEFHGTGHLFQRMDSQPVLLLLWVTVNLVQGDIINFNPILARVDPSESDSRVEKVEEEAGSINKNYLDLNTLRKFSEQLYENRNSFIVGTGFQLKVNPETHALDIDYIDMDENFEKLEIRSRSIIGFKISEIPVEVLEELEILFAETESFYQSHLRLISQEGSDLKLPERQKMWFRKAENLREYLKSNFLDVLFEPENVYTNLDLLYSHCRSLLRFILPEFMSLENLNLPGKIYLKSPILDHTLTSVRKLQALIRRQREHFQDVQLLHKLAQREFGPMAAGIVGLEESQIETLESLVEHLSQNQSLFRALIKSFIFRDLGLIPKFREKYKDQINPADHAAASAFLLEKEKIHERYTADKEEQQDIITLVRYHDFPHHMIRGEFPLSATQEIINARDKDLFDAFFVTSFIMFSAMREDMVLEDLATIQFRIRSVCHNIIDGKTTLGSHLEEVYARRGHLFQALEAYQQKGLPDKVAPAKYLETFAWQDSKRDRYIETGKIVYAMERIFRLRGIRYVEFYDLANLMVKVPLKFIYKKRQYAGVGYATFEKELFEALRIYNGLQVLNPEVRHFILERLTTDEVRIFGFENVTIYMNYDNMIKLLLFALLGSQKLGDDERPECLNFLDMAETIEKRYEAVNDELNGISVEKVWGNSNRLTHFFRAKTGIVFKRNESQKVLTVDFVDKTNIAQKTSYMETITDVEQLKNYFHYSLRSLRKSPFYTDDYELELEKAFENRLREIIDLILDQTKKQLELLKDFREIHGVVADLMDRSWDKGFTEDQRHRLNDIYDLRIDELKREKLEEVDHFLETIQEHHELKDYWDSIKWYLLDNRQYLGKEFEGLIARKFDEAVDQLEGAEIFA